MTTLTASTSPATRLRTYASFVRFEHTLFSLPLILAGIFCVEGPALTASRWALIAVAAVGARTAAMALNRLIDRRLDALNPRTRSRELPAEKMRTGEAVALLVASIAVYLAACAALGPWYLKVAIIPLVVFAGYPYLKRFTPLCHFGVGLALALAPLAGFAAAHPEHLKEPWFLSLPMWLAAFAFFWVSGFDIIYATLDEEFDRSERVQSMVAWLGRTWALRISAVLHVIAFSCLLITILEIWNFFDFRIRVPWALPALILIVLGAGILLYLEQKWAEDVNLAFFKVNVYVGFAVLAAILVARIGGA